MQLAVLVVIVYLLHTWAEEGGGTSGGNTRMHAHINIYMYTHIHKHKNTSTQMHTRAHTQTQTCTHREEYAFVRGDHAAGGHQEDEAQVLQLGGMHEFERGQVTSQAQPPMHCKAEGGHPGE